MSWYWWVIIGILAINGFIIVLIALALAANWWRKKRAARLDQRDESDAPEAP